APLRVDRLTVVAREDHVLDIASHEPLVREGGEVERTEDYAWTPAVVQRRRDDGERGGYAGREADLLLRRVQHACDAAAQLRQPAEPDLVPRRRAERMPLVVELCDARVRATRERAERAGVQVVRSREDRELPAPGFPVHARKVDRSARARQARR